MYCCAFLLHNTSAAAPQFMAPLSALYEQEVRKWLLNHPGCSVTIYQIGNLFNAAFSRAATVQNAVKGFGKTGICPEIYEQQETLEVRSSTALPAELQPSKSSCTSTMVEPQPPRPISRSTVVEPQPSTPRPTTMEQSQPSTPQPCGSAFTISPKTLIPPQEIDHNKKVKNDKRRDKEGRRTSGHLKEKRARLASFVMRYSSTQRIERLGFSVAVVKDVHMKPVQVLKKKMTPSYAQLYICDSVNKETDCDDTTCLLGVQLDRQLLLWFPWSRIATSQLGTMGVTHMSPKCSSKADTTWRGISVSLVQPQAKRRNTRPGSCNRLPTLGMRCYLLGQVFDREQSPHIDLRRGSRHPESLHNISQLLTTPVSEKDFTTSNEDKQWTPQEVSLSPELETQLRWQILMHMCRG
ncbi:hypothetical protein PR048_008165 [Dryococelus australis]|uniref:Uncharacterized protein n=1 Tax=Dryococelus australis TaxID=614101 RepID=A0ABQ9HWB6_9NEOP|nr:hypothetical protein PR048_008165 [Dryococelus australis]